MSERDLRYWSAPMAAEISRRLFTADDYHRMGEAGIPG
jgi:hypothetical protein